MALLAGCFAWFTTSMYGWHGFLPVDVVRWVLLLPLA
jgi:hypothetical protein